MFFAFFFSIYFSFGSHVPVHSELLFHASLPYLATGVRKGTGHDKT